MFFLFAATQLVTNTIGAIRHPNPSEWPNSYLLTLALIILFIGAIGAIAGFIYAKICNALPPFNLYIFTPIYLILANLLILFISWIIIQQGTGFAKGTVTITMITVTITKITGMIVYTIITGCLFSWLYQRKQQT